MIPIQIIANIVEDVQGDRDLRAPTRAILRHIENARQNIRKQKEGTDLDHEAEGETERREREAIKAQEGAIQKRETAEDIDLAKDALDHQILLNEKGDLRLGKILEADPIVLSALLNQCCQKNPR